MNITPITPAIFYDDAEFRRRSRLRRDSDLRNTMFNELARTMVNRQRVNQSIIHLGNRPRRDALNRVNVRNGRILSRDNIRDIIQFL